MDPKKPPKLANARSPSIDNGEITSECEDGFPKSLISVSQTQNNASVTEETGCTLSEPKLSFDLEGDTFPVSKLTDTDPSTSLVQTIQLINNNKNVKYHFEISQLKSPKWLVEVSPASGQLSRKHGKNSVDITIRFKVFCTTRVDHRIAVKLIPHTNRKLFSSSKKNAPQESPHSLLITIRGESSLSDSIDYEEIEFEKEIASGGFGTVFKARWRGLDVAVKKLHVQDLTPEDKAIFQREIRLMKLLSCQFVVTLMGSTQIPGAPVCLVMEYVPLGSLTLLLDKPMSDYFKCKIALDIAKGMSFLHNNNIYHRDLKPDNVLVISEMEHSSQIIKITDFDTARAYLLESKEYYKNYQSFLQAAQEKANPRKQRYLSNMGTLIYKAPEVMDGTMDANEVDKTFGEYFVSFVVTCFPLACCCGICGPKRFRFPIRNIPNGTRDVRSSLRLSLEIESFIKSGQRLPIPSTIDPRVASLIKLCWDPKPKRRPDMGSLQTSFADLLQTFKPSDGHSRSSSLSQSQTSISSRNNSSSEFPPAEYTPPEDIQGWVGWHGNITRAEAEFLLMPTSQGTFLLRWSSRARSYVMSYRGLHRVEHIADISPRDGAIDVVKQNGDTKSFPSLRDYIEAMMKQKVIREPLITQEQEQTSYARTKEV